jgi:hypothetical protein
VLCEKSSVVLPAEQIGKETQVLLYAQFSMSSSAFEVPFSEASAGFIAAPELSLPGQMDEDSSSFKSDGGFRDEGVNDALSRKVMVDKAFSLLVSRVRKDRKAPRPNPEHDEDTPFLGDGEDDDELGRSSDDDANTENLDDFSGLEDLNLSEDEDDFKRDGVIELKRKKPKQREYAPNGRKQRGYHKWAGRLVALLSSGETGVVLKRTGGRIKIRLDENPSYPISSSEEKLHLLENTSSFAAINEIYDAARYVPQLKDLRVGQRVAMTRFENATGRIVRLPDEKRAMNGLGHVVIEPDMSGERLKAVMESLRLLDDNHPVIPFPSLTHKSLGRPTKAVVANKTPPPQITPIIPFSKRGDEWRRSLKAPTGTPSPPSSPVGSMSEEDDETRKRREDDPNRQTLVKRSRHLGDASTPNKPVLTRGQKLCKACNGVIGTACRSCPHCGAVCARPSKKV